MEKLLLALNGVVQLAVGITMFALLWVIIFKTVEKIPFLAGKLVGATVATCVSLLSVIGMLRFLGARDGTYNSAHETGGDSSNVNCILLPYAALGIAILLLALYLFVSRLLGRDKSRKSPTDTERRSESIFHLNRGNGNKPPEVKAAEASREIPMMHESSRAPKRTDRPSGKHVDQNDGRKGTRSSKIKR